MKNSILGLLIILGLWGSTPGWAQTTYSGQGNPLRELRDALSPLNPSRIPTGVLLNRMMLMTNPHRFAGQGDTVATYNGFEQQYWEYYHAALDSSRLLTLDALRASINQRVQQGTVPLLMLQYSYNEFTATAAQDHLITIDSVNERVSDGPDLSRSPYATGQFFSVALPLPAARGPLAVYVGPEYWLGNRPNPGYVYLDFGDGLGWRRVAMGSTVQVQVNPASTGTTARGTSMTGPVQTIFAYEPNYWNMAATGIQYQKAASVAPDVALGLVASRFWESFRQSEKAAPTPQGRATAIAWIKYATSNTTGKLRRPLVFVEGIDFDRYRNGYVSNTTQNHYIAQTGPLPLTDFETGFAAQRGGYRNGTAGWNEMVDYNPEYKSLEKFPELRAQLQAPANTSFPNGASGGDYDLIYLDFTDGASKIQHNAMVLAELLEWINQPANRTADAEETMVIGTSMGGQVARFALAWMEQQSLCHNSKLYISFDSPHRGANVPLGIQHLLDRLKGVWVGAGSAYYVTSFQLLREASMQMLNFHYNFDAAGYRSSWQSWQASPGSYPSLLRKVAVANGSGQAVFPLGTFPGMRLIHTKGAGIITGPNYAYALPGTSIDGHSNVVFVYRKAISLSNNWRYTIR